MNDTALAEAHSMLAIEYLLLATVIACGLVLPTSARAASVVEWNYLNPAASCQPSNAEDRPDLRPRATGLRNEGRTNGAFVICGYSEPGADGPSTAFEIWFAPMDGVSREIRCTAVTGLAGTSGPVYSSKSVSSTSKGTFAFLRWVGSDFYDTRGIMDSFSASVTCLLPPQTAITLVTNRYKKYIDD
jgi:hypothetical protein